MANISFVKKTVFTKLCSLVYCLDEELVWFDCKTIVNKYLNLSIIKWLFNLYSMANKIYKIRVRKTPEKDL